MVIASRKTGASSGTTDKYYIAPSVPKDAPEGFTTRVKFRSEAEVVNYARQLFGVPSSRTIPSRQISPRTRPPPPDDQAQQKGEIFGGYIGRGASRGGRRGRRRDGGRRGRRRRRFRRRFRVSSNADVSESDSEGADAGEETYGVQVEGMLTVMDADKARRAFEKRVLTPAKARELEEHIESQLANPSMGFDVDVLQLEYQRVTGFEALTDDPMELREMLQKVVQREKEKASAAAGGDAAGMFSRRPTPPYAATTRKR